MPEPTETTTDSTTDAAPDTEATQEESTDPSASPDLAAEVAKWKAMSRKHEQQWKATADKAKRFDEIEEASKSELEKAQARAQELESAVKEANLKATRSEIAAAKGVPAELLTGDDDESLNASADQLLAFRGQTPKAGTTDGQGKVGDSQNVNGVKQLTREDLKGMSTDQINEAREAGQLNKLQGIS